MIPSGSVTKVVKSWGIVPDDFSKAGISMHNAPPKIHQCVQGYLRSPQIVVQLFGLYESDKSRWRIGIIKHEIAISPDKAVINHNVPACDVY